MWKKDATVKRLTKQELVDLLNISDKDYLSDTLLTLKSEILANGEKAYYISVENHVVFSDDELNQLACKKLVSRTDG